MAKIEEEKAQDTSSSRPTSPNEQLMLNQSTEAQKSSRPTSPNASGLDSAPRIPSLDLEFPQPDTPAPVPGPPESVVSKQPDAKENLQLGPLVPLNDLSRDKAHESSSPLHKKATRDSFQRPRGAKRRACGAGWNRFMRWTYVAFVWIGRALLVLGVGLGMVFMAALTLSISLGSAAANGAIWMLIGNAILRATHHSGYIDSNRVVAIVGAVGCIFAAMCVGIVINFLPRTSYNDNTGEAEHSWVIRAPAMVCAGALAGPIGVSILKRHHFNLEGLDVLHAARAGALGATVMGPAMILLVPVIFLVLGLLLSPLWIAMSLGLEFMYAKTNETISEDGWYKYSSCFCIGSCRDDPDPEIQEQWAKQDMMAHRTANAGNHSWV